MSSEPQASRIAFILQEAQERTSWFCSVGSSQISKGRKNGQPKHAAGDVVALAEAGSRVGVALLAADEGVVGLSARTCNVFVRRQQRWARRARAAILRHGAPPMHRTRAAPHYSAVAIGATADTSVHARIIALIPGSRAAAAGVLGAERCAACAITQRGSGRRDHEPCYLPPRARPRALVGMLPRGCRPPRR